MKIAIRPENINSRKALAGKVSLVTGATSASALALPGLWPQQARKSSSTALGSRKRSLMCRRRSLPNSDNGSNAVSDFRTSALGVDPIGTLAPQTYILRKDMSR